MAIATKMTLKTTVEINGSHENTGAPVIKETDRAYICSGAGLKASSNGEI